MSWNSNRSKVRPLVRAALLVAALAPALASPTRAAPSDADSSFARSIIFAVDPVLGQAYLAPSVSDDQPEGSIAVLSLASRRAIGSIPYTVAPSALAVNPVTGLVYIASKAQDTITVVHGPTLRVVTTAKISGGPQVLLLEPASGRLFVGLARERSIKALDISTLSSLGTAELGMEPVGLGFDRVRNRLMAVAVNVDPEPAALIAIDNDRLTFVNKLDLPERPDGLAVLDGGGPMFVPLASEGDVLVVDAEQLNVINRLSGWETRVRDIAVNERRSRLYLAAGDPDLLIALDPLTGLIVGSVKTGAATAALTVDQATARIYTASPEGISIGAIMDPAEPRIATSDLSITFQVTGGLAGLNDVLTIKAPGLAHLERRQGAPIDVELGMNRFQELAALFPESDFYNMLPRHVALRPIPDALTFSVTARDSQREHTVVMSTAGSPPMPLIDIVRRLERVRQEMISPQTSAMLRFTSPSAP